MTRKNINKKVHKTLAVAMSAMLVVSSPSFQVMAAPTATDSNATSITETSGNGSLESPSTTQTTTTVTDQETKQTTTTVDVTISGTGTNADGATVNLNITTENVTVTDENGKVLTESGAESGKEVTTEISTTTEEVDVTPTDNSTTVVGETTTTPITGDNTVTDSSEDPTISNDIELDYTGEVAVTVTPGTENTAKIETNESLLAAENISVPQDSSNTTTDEETGIKTTTIVTYEAITDGAGNIIGYTTTTTVTTENSSSETVTETSDPEISTTTGETETVVTSDTVIVLPAKPAASETLDETTGQKTSITVEELFDTDGNVVGYQSTTIITDENGNVIKTGTDSVFGVKKTTTTTNTTPTTTTSTTNNFVTTTTTTFITNAVTTSGTQVVATDRTVWAQMSEVTNGENHGIVETNSIQPDLSILPEEGTYDAAKDLYHRKETLTGELTDGYSFVFQGDSGLESSIRVDPNGDAEGNSNYIAHQFILIDDDGNKHFAYCADFDTSIQDGYNYNMVNVEDASYYNSTAAQMIVAIARHGYWGTEEGSDGSLSSLKANLAAARAEALANGETFPLTEAQINELTHGQALTATQAAIWVYGNGSQTTRMDHNKIAGDNYALGSTEADNLEEQKDRDAVNALYRYFLSLDPESVDDPTSFINAEDFAQSATITVKELAEDEFGALLSANTDDDTENDVYNTDITFALSIVPSGINDDLIVTVYDSDGNAIAKRRLTGEDSNSVNRVKENEDGTYTIENIQLAENVNITLNLSGTQALDTGVYLYSSENRNGTTSQTFVGIASGDNKRNVNLNVDLKFSATEPTAEVLTSKSSETTERTDVTIEERTDVVIETAVTATVVVTTEEETEYKWENLWSYEAPTAPEYPVTPHSHDDSDDSDEPNEPDDPVVPQVLGAEDTLIPTSVIEDNAVPLGVLGATDTLKAVAPATGDTSGLWAILTALSGLLLSGFCFIDKKRKTTR